MHLLHAHILSQDPGAVIEVITRWEKEPGTEIKDRIAKRMHMYPFDPLRNNYLLFDNAQQTYWDGLLWEIFVKDTIQGGCGVFAVLFCRYGSSTTRPVNDDNGTPLVLDGGARISLTTHHDDASDAEYPQIGL